MNYLQNKLDFITHCFVCGSRREHWVSACNAASCETQLYHQLNRDRTMHAGCIRAYAGSRRWKTLVPVVIYEYSLRIYCSLTCPRVLSMTTIGGRSRHPMY